MICFCSKGINCAFWSWVILYPCCFASIFCQFLSSCTLSFFVLCRCWSASLYQSILLVVICWAARALGLFVQISSSKVGNMGLLIKVLVCKYRIGEQAQVIACQCSVCCIMGLHHLEFDEYEMLLGCIGCNSTSEIWVATFLSLTFVFSTHGLGFRLNQK